MCKLLVDVKVASNFYIFNVRKNTIILFIVLFLALFLNTKYVYYIIYWYSIFYIFILTVGQSDW